MDIDRSSSALQAGLSQAEISARLHRYGPNALPEPRAPFLVTIFLRQFLSPPIYILLAVALVSLIAGELRDVLFIGVVLLINGMIGTFKEYSAARATAALRRLEQQRASVVRDGVRQEIDSKDLVPGDLVMLEAGGRVPADLRLLECTALHCDESLLTGESAFVEKQAMMSAEATPIDRHHALVFAGTMVKRGRGAAFLPLQVRRPTSGGLPMRSNSDRSLCLR